VAGEAPRGDDDRPAVAARRWRISSVPVPRTVPWTAVHVVSLAGAAVILLVANRNQWFFGDDWEFIVNRGPRDQRLGLFTAHNEHWSTLPILIYRGLLATVGLRSYTPYVVVLIAVHLVLAHLLWRVARRAGASPAIATALAGIFAVLGAGADNLLWAFQVGFVGCIMLGWAAVLLHDHDGPFGGRDVLGWLAASAALMMSGPAIVMVGVATLTVALRRRRLLDTVLTPLGPGLVFVVWWLFAGRNAPSGAPDSDDGVWLLADFAWRGLTNAAEQAVGIPGAGALLVLALTYWWVRHLDLASGRAAAAFAGTVGSLAFFLITGSGRIALGLDASTSGRYVYIGAALLVPAAALALSRSVPGGTGPTAFVLVICGVVAWHNVGALREAASNDMAREQAYKDLVLAAAALVGDGEPVVSEVIDPTFNPDLGTDELVRIVGYDWLPDAAPTATDTLSARAALQTAVEEPSGPLGPVRLSGERVVFEPLPPVEGAECAFARFAGAGAAVTLGSDAPEWRVRLLSDDPATVGVTVGDGRETGKVKNVSLAAGEPADLVSVADRNTVALTVPAGGLALCGIALPPA
jgi:hypothetical protein